MASPDTTVFIIDDDPLVRTMLETLVGGAGRATACFEAADAFLSTYDVAQPGCLISDICMPGMSGLELQTELNRRGATVPVIFISGRNDVPTAVAAMRHGAFDFLLKPFAHDELLQRVQAALARDEEIRLGIQQLEEIRARREQLTPRELDVLARLVKGMPNKIISDELSLSTRTVELHRSHVMEKMRAKSVAQLVRMVLELERSPGPATK